MRKNRIDKNYPYYLPWAKAKWIVKVGDRVEIEGEEYEITNVRLKPIPGRPPDITVKHISLLNEEEVTEQSVYIEEDEPF